MSVSRYARFRRLAGASEATALVSAICAFVLVVGSLIARAGGSSSATALAVVALMFGILTVVSFIAYAQWSARAEFAIDCEFDKLSEGPGSEND